MPQSNRLAIQPSPLCLEPELAHIVIPASPDASGRSVCPPLNIAVCDSMKPMQMNRRRWLQHAGAGCYGVAHGMPWLAGATATAVPTNQSGRRIAAQAYVFSQYHARRGERLRDFVGQMLQSHAEAGVYELELLADLVSAELLPDLRRECAASGVAVPAVYAGAMLYESGSQRKAIETARAVAGRSAAAGARYLNCNPQPKPRKQRKSDEELAVEAEGIRRLADDVRREGLTLLLHQHDAEMHEGARNWRYWLRHTDSSNVGICFDIHWAYRAGQDVLDLLKECRPRLESLHLRNSRQGIWWESLDDGDVDYRPVADFLRQTGYRGLLVAELAWEDGMHHARSLADNLRLSRHYVERRFL